MQRTSVEVFHSKLRLGCSIYVTYVKLRLVDDVGRDVQPIAESYASMLVVNLNC